MLLVSSTERTPDSQLLFFEHPSIKQRRIFKLKNNKNTDCFESNFMIINTVSKSFGHTVEDFQSFVESLVSSTNALFESGHLSRIEVVVCAYEFPLSRIAFIGNHPLSWRQCPLRRCRKTSRSLCAPGAVGPFTQTNFDSLMLRPIS